MNEIQRYFKYRQGLIDQYVKGDMTKSEYLGRNLDAVLSLNIQPFKNIDTVEKGLFNYQYFNAMAKDAKNYDEDLMAEYYRKKDRSTIAVLRLLDYKDVTSYYIRARSRILQGKLIEIVIEDWQMILHTTSELILKLLRDEGVFTGDTRTSLIDGYINQKY